MTKLIRLDMPKTGQGRRWTLGLAVSSRCTRVSAALVAAAGRGLDSQIDIAGVLSAEVPRETAMLFAPATAKGNFPTGALSTLRAELAEVQSQLVAELLAGLSVAPSRVLAIGVHDPGLWSRGSGGPGGYLGLCDAARLAESTGLNVIDALAARDLAQGGQGGPLTALPQWILLRDPKRTSVLLDVGRTVQMTYLPATLADHAASRILSFQVGPGTGLLDELARRLSGETQQFDPGGCLAVQGRQVPEIVEHWLANPYFDRPLPRWHPMGVRPERFLADALRMAVDNGWSVRDLLCSATHFIAEMIVQTLHRRLPENSHVDEIIITGGGQQNGMLLREITRRTEIPLRRISELGIPPESLDPACIATLALLYIDQVPANQTAVTRTDVPRLLGRLTPGSPQNWQRLLQTCAGSSTAVRPLRSAI